MNDLIRTILTGAIAGGIYSLIGVGLVVTFSVTGIFDLGYGGIAYSAALIFYELNTALGWNRFVAAGFVIFILCPLLGLFLNVALYRPLAHASETVKLVTSVGVLVALPALTEFVITQGIDTFDWGLNRAENLTAVPGVVSQPATNWTLPGRIVVNSNELTVLALGAVVCVGLWLMFRSRFGLQMRAVRDRRELASLRGVNERRTTMVVAVIGSTLAGLAGVAGAPILTTLDTGTFTIALLTASAAVVIGRFRSVPWTFAGGLILGIVVNLMFRYVKIDQVPSVNQAAPFIILLIGLVVLGRSRSRIAGSASFERVRPDWRADLTTFQRLRLPLAVSTVFIGLAYFKFSGYWTSLTLRSLAIVLILMSLTVVTGLGGLVSLAQAALASTAALTTALFVKDHGWPFLLAGLAGILAALLMGMIVAIPSIRLGGVPFALATLALALIAQTILLNNDLMTNGGFGWKIQRPEVFGAKLTDKTLILVLSVLIGVMTWVITNLRRSASGRRQFAVRATQAAADSLGISAPAARLRLIAVSSVMAGLGGVVLLLVDKGASSVTLEPLSGIMWLTVIVVLGAGRPAAAVLGGFALILWPGLLGAGFTFPFDLFSWDGIESIYLPAILFGLGAIDLARNPDGVLDRISRQRYMKRTARRESADDAAPDAAIGALEAPAFVRDPITAGSAVPAAEAALQVDVLHSGYDLVEVVRGATFQVPRGKVTVLLGANGAGKSTICKTIVGELPAMSGSVTLSGTPLDGDPVKRWRNGILLVPETRGVFPGLSVLDNLKLGLPDARHRSAAIERFPVLGARARLEAGSLSGGEQQMLSLVGPLTDAPTLLIVDEPTLGLAPMVAETVLDVLRELAERGTTVLIAEEKQHTMSTVADHVVLVALGRTIWQGPPGEVPPQLLAAAYGLHEDVAAAIENDAPMPDAEPV